MVLIRVNCDEVCSSENPLKLFKNVRGMQKVSGTELYWTLLNWQECVLDWHKISQALNIQENSE